MTRGLWTSAALSGMKDRRLFPAPRRPAQRDPDPAVYCPHKVIVYRGCMRCMDLLCAACYAVHGCSSKTSPPMKPELGPGARAVGPDGREPERDASALSGRPEGQVLSEAVREASGPRTARPPGEA